MIQVPRRIYIIIALFVLIAGAFVLFKLVINPKTAYKELIKKHPNFPTLSRVLIEPHAPLSTQYIQAMPELAQGNIKTVTFQYRWYVNGQPVEDEVGTNVVLEQKNYKKGDTVFCRVIARRGEMVTEAMESESVRIANAPPEIIISPFPKFSIPNEINYKIEAVDGDGDTLTYRLISPLDKGITVDADSGMLHWKISLRPEDFGQNVQNSEGDSGNGGQTEQTKAPLNPNISIKIEVKDSDGAASTTEFHLNLLEGGEVSG